LEVATNKIGTKKKNPIELAAISKPDQEHSEDHRLKTLVMQTFSVTCNASDLSTSISAAISLTSSSVYATPMRSRYAIRFML